MLFEKKEKKEEKDIYLQIRLKQREKEYLKQIAQEHNLTMTELVKNACNEYVKTLTKERK